MNGNVKFNKKFCIGVIYARGESIFYVCPIEILKCPIVFPSKVTLSHSLFIPKSSLNYSMGPALAPVVSLGQG